jgi:hypothetical protein
MIGMHAKIERVAQYGGASPSFIWLSRTLQADYSRAASILR